MSGYLAESGSEIMEAIGGYFELELRHGEHYHEQAIRLNSARNCFEYILLARRYKKVYMPYYTCEVMLQPLLKYGIPYEFYSINEALEPNKTIKLLPNEAFLYTNYFGLKQDCVERLASIYKTQLIIDNAQAFFTPRIDSIDTFYSPRKFFGVPDGGYLYTDCTLNHDFLIDKSCDRIGHLVNRIEEGAEVGYAAFRKADDSLDNQPIRKMSKLTEQILQSIDYEYIRNQRRDNFNILQNELNNINLFSFSLIYPYYAKDIDLKSQLIKKRVFVATYWPNVEKWCVADTWEYQLAEHLVAMPIDQRYGVKEMKKIVTLIKLNLWKK